MEFVDYQPRLAGPIQGHRGSAHEYQFWVWCSDEPSQFCDRRCALDGRCNPIRGQGGEIHGLWRIHRQDFGFAAAHSGWCDWLDLRVLVHSDGLARDQTAKAWRRSANPRANFLWLASSEVGWATKSRQGYKDSGDRHTTGARSCGRDTLSSECAECRSGTRVRL